VFAHTNKKREEQKFIFLQSFVSNILLQLEISV
jgi:hypothetical protein